MAERRPLEPYVGGSSPPPPATAGSRRRHPWRRHRRPDLTCGPICHPSDLMDTVLRHHGRVLDIARLGRSVVVRPGEPAPAAWRDCDRVAVTAVDPGLAAQLHQAWRERRPLVVEVAPGIGLDDPAGPAPETVTGLQPWEWPVDLDLPGERLHHSVWANAVDGRRADRLGWRWAEEAERAGAARCPDGTADVLLPDGEPALCDGGPLDATLGDRLGCRVLHRVAIEHRSLRPLTLAGTGRSPTTRAGPAGARTVDRSRTRRSRTAGARPVGGGRRGPGRRPGTGPGRVGQDPGAHRAGPGSGPGLGPTPGRAGAGRLQRAGRGRDA